MAEQSPTRIVLAKVGLDGHDRGIKVVAAGCAMPGMHVIYAGLWQSPEAVVRTVADEDADWLGLSLLSGAHMTLVPRVLELLRAGRIWTTSASWSAASFPKRDMPKLLRAGRRAGVRAGHRRSTRSSTFLVARRGAEPCLTSCSIASRKAIGWRCLGC